VVEQKWNTTISSFLKYPRKAVKASI
jgi:hypothetical protein